MKIYSPQVIGQLDVNGNTTITGSLGLVSGSATISGSILSPAVNTNTLALLQGNVVIGGQSNTVPSANVWNVVIGGFQNSAVGGSTNGVFGGYISQISAASGQNKNIYGATLGNISGTGESLTMVGGLQNTLSATANQNVIVGGSSNTLSASSTNNQINSGNGNTISGASANSVIIGGQSNTIAGRLRSVVLGGSSISATANDTVYVPNLDVSGSSTFKASTVFSGSVRGEVSALSISSNTASLDLSRDNFFTLQLVSGSDTFINPTNILPGQTVNIRINTTGSATVSFPSSVKQPSGSAYVPTTSTGVDVLTLISFDSTSLYLSNVKNLI